MMAHGCCLTTQSICPPFAGLQKDDGSSSQPLLTADARDEQHITATSTAVVGLSNLGNTCFFNSSVQLLLACAPLQQMLLQHDHHIAKGPLGYALQQAAMFANGACYDRQPVLHTCPAATPAQLASGIIETTSAAAAAACPYLLVTGMHQQQQLCVMRACRTA
jgi:hypothetical protein